MSAYDVTWVVDRLPQGTGKSAALDLRLGGGGMAANAAVAAARLGAKVQFWGRGGDDAAGRAMHEELASQGVDVSHFRLFAQARSSVSGIMVDASGERMIVNFRGADLPGDAQWLPLAEVADADAVLADPRWPQGALALFREARRRGIPTVLDADVAEDAVFDALLPYTDYAVFSEPGLAGYAARTAGAEMGLRHARERGCMLAAVTLGERGVVWDDGHAVARLPALPVRVVDTTGAGDVFHGALAYAFGARMPVRDAFQFSSAVAALKCKSAGGRAGAPDLAAVMSFLHDLKE